MWDYTYNSAHLVETEILTVDNQSWSLDPSYNGLGHMTSLVYPSGTSVSYAPNALGQAKQAGTYATNAAYHPNGQLKSFSYGNGLTFTQSLDGEYRPYERQVKSGSTLRVGQRYNYDANDNLSAITDLMNSSKNLSLGFDGLDRLTVANGYWGSGSLSYNQVGNITGKTLGAQALTYTYNSNNLLTSVTGGYSFSYDGRGTVTNNGKRTFTVNGANQMTSSGGISYSYDGHNRRVKKVNGASTQYSFYDQSGKFLSTTGTNGPTEYIYLGSQLVARVSQVTTTDDKPGYTGHLEDKDIGLTYMQQRYYDPIIGRFYSNDPVSFSASDPMLFNRYAYANNNPYKYTDPDGRAVDTVVDAAFTIYDAGQTLGAAAAYVEGVVTGNEALTAVAGDGLASAATNLAMSAGSVLIPGASAPLARAIPHGNSKASTKDQHLYMIQDSDGNIKKVGISGQPLNQNGSSPRANAQLTPGDKATVLESGIPGREAALGKEAQTVEGLKRAGEVLPDQKRPKS